jgi:hypothetical protein
MHAYSQTLNVMAHDTRLHATVQKHQHTALSPVGNDQPPCLQMTCPCRYATDEVGAAE